MIVDNCSPNGIELWKYKFMFYVINPDVYKKVKYLSSLYHTATPFSHVIIDNFLDASLAQNLLRDFPEISEMSRSHHYLFANKYELQIGNRVSNSFSNLYEELTSNNLRLFLSELVGEDLFVDTEFCGDIHQGINGSFLEMHTDFNLHPMKDNWLHCLNIIIYLNKEWKEDFGGELILKSQVGDLKNQISPQFNRCVIMQSNDNTYHGYSQLRLPKELTRKSIIIPVYKKEICDNLPPRHLTNFAPEQDYSLKKSSAKFYNYITQIKARLKRQLTKRS